MATGFGGKCDKGDACECTTTHTLTLRAFCEHWKATEQSLDGDAVYQQNIRNWCALPLATRKRCLYHLKIFMSGAEDVVARWRDQSKRRVVIGSDNIRFHLSEGMQIRNALRSVVKDDQLPTKNWDDFYYGALEALVSE